MKGLTLSICFTLLSVSQVFASLPKNDLHLEDNRFRFFSTMTEEKFNEIITHAEGIYAPIVESHGATLNFDRNWNDATVNAYAQQSGSTWNVAMFGGLARRPEVTEDGFALVVCHELGHHLAGFPFYGNTDWAASEGQSDYFASQICARKLWGDQTEINASFRDQVHPIAKQGCDSSWQTQEDRDLCYRTAMAGYSLADLLATISNSTPVSFENVDATQVSHTQTSHPRAQCRLDTYFAGALCGRNFEDEVIPARRHPDGQTSLAAEEVASQFSCMKPDFFMDGSRPNCWFKPERPQMIGIGEAVWEEVYGNNNGVIEPGEAFRLSNQLENRTGFAYENLRVSIAPSVEGAVAIESESNHSRLEPYGTSLQEEPFLVYFEPSMDCGVSVDMNVGVDLGDRKGILGLESLLGSTAKSEGVTSYPVETIPDNEPQNGILSAAWISKEQTARAAEVHVKITHTYVGDLQINLITPEGKVMVLREKQGGSQDNIDETYRVEIDRDTVVGVWALQVIDSGASDEGTLEEWTLRFEEAECNIPQPEWAEAP